MTETGVADTHEHPLARAESQAAQEAAFERREINRGSVGRVEAEEVDVRQGAVGLAQADKIKVRQGAVGAAVGRDVEVRQGFSRLAAARNSVKLEQAGAMTVVANHVEMGRQSGVVFLFARSVTGNVRPVFDWRAGLAFGAVVGAFGVLRGAISRHRR